MPPPSADGDYYVSPVYLAGPTHTGDPALQPLLNCGFVLTGDELGNVYVNSPDQRLRLGYMLEGADYTLWKVTAHRLPFAEPEWMATFNASTPTELVTAFTSTLADLYQDDAKAVLITPSGTPQDGWHPLEHHGWRHTTHQLTTLVTASDGLAGLTYSGRYLPHRDELSGERQRWLLWGGQDGYLDRWYATFTSKTPTSLINATTTRLANPVPVLRYEHDVPRRNRTMARVHPVRRRVPTPLDVQRAAAARVHSHGHAAIKAVCRLGHHAPQHLVHDTRGMTAPGIRRNEAPETTFRPLPGRCA